MHIHLGFLFSFCTIYSPISKIFKIICVARDVKVIAGLDIHSRGRAGHSLST